MRYRYLVKRLPCTAIVLSLLLFNSVLQAQPAVRIMPLGDSITGSGSSLTGTNVGYNGSIGPGQSVSFGMQGTSGSSIGTPDCTAD